MPPIRRYWWYYFTLLLWLFYFFLAFCKLIVCIIQIDFIQDLVIILCYMYFNYSDIYFCLLYILTWLHQEENVWITLCVLFHLWEVHIHSTKKTHNWLKKSLYGLFQSKIGSPRWASHIPCKTWTESICYSGQIGIGSTWNLVSQWYGVNKRWM